MIPENRSEPCDAVVLGSSDRMRISEHFCSRFQKFHISNSPEDPRIKVERKRKSQQAKNRDWRKDIKSQQCQFGDTVTDFKMSNGYIRSSF